MADGPNDVRLYSVPTDANPNDVRLGRTGSAPHNFSASMIDRDVLFAALSGHVSSGGSSLATRLRSAGRRQLIFRRRRHP